VAHDGLDLEPDENFFAFEFAAMDFVDASQNRYRYRLEGLDPDWIDAGGNPVANYTSVPPDRYVFRVAARNSEGVWNENALVIPLRVQAPFHQTMWFRSLVLVALMSIGWGLLALRRRELQARERVRVQAREGLRTEIAGELHDDIGANLSTIVQKAWLVGSAAALDDRGRTHLADMSRLATESVDRVRETVWVVNTKYDTVADLMKKMQDTVDTMLTGQVEHSFTKSIDQPQMVVSMETRRNIYLMFKESLHNIVKHAAASTVGIEIETTGDDIRFRVTDDGVGFDPNADGGGSGQDLLRRRAELCRGEVRVSSSPGEGTTVEVRAKLS
jgi:signal transduction histidine kinase